MSLQFNPPAPEFRNMLKPQMPCMWSVLEPRRYQVPAGFPNPAPLAGISFASAFRDDDQDEVTAITNMARYFIAARLSQYAVPTMLISRELVHALRRTVLPADLCLQDIKLPFPAMRFIFQEGSLPFAHGELAFIEYAHYSKGDMVSLPDEAYDDRPESRQVFRPAASVTEESFSFSSGFKMNARRHDWESRDTTVTRYGDDLKTLSWLDKPSDDQLYGAQMSYLPPLSEGMPPTGALLFNLLLFISAKPEHVEAETVMRAPRQKRNRLVDGLYCPQKVGMKFNLVALKTLKTPGESTGRKLAPGWRCGHWRNVPHGPGRLERRWTHIEPYPYGSEQPESQAA